MKFRDFGILSDENLDPEVVQWLVDSGFDVLDVCRARLLGTRDVDLLHRAVTENRVIVTDHADFGTLAILQGEPLIGVVYLRPGHSEPTFTIESLKTLLDADPDVTPPFIVVVRRTNTQVMIRIRNLSS